MNIVRTNNCPTQYKCCQNFWKVASSGTTNNSVIIHKFAQKFRFKGLWDATGKLVKQAIQNNELRFERCANAWDCYIKMKRDLIRSGQERKQQKRRLNMRAMRPNKVPINVGIHGNQLKPKEFGFTRIAFENFNSLGVGEQNQDKIANM